MNYTDERICSIALTLCTGIGALTAQRLVQMAGSAAAVFSRREELARTCPDIQPAALKALDTPGIFTRAEQELPTRLRQCEDAPLFLFYSGTGNLNSLRVVSMVGTRNATDYGRQWCNSFIRDLAALCPDLLVVSGLAYGIDIASHRAALAHHVPTVAVLAHGLDRIYPAIHRKTATEMLAQGGLLTEFLTGTEPERYNFLSRNRIVAGMADAVIVVESGRKGGSLITASLAEGYHRDCFAVPGRATDEHSAGCNRLIRDNKAALVQNAEDFVQAMNWSTAQMTSTPVQRNLFQELTDEEGRIVQLLGRQGDQDVNTLVVESGIPFSRLSALLFEMELKGIIKAQTGNVYHLLG